MKKILLLFFVIILINVYLWRNPVSEEIFAFHKANKSLVLEFSFTNKCTYNVYNENRDNNCRYSYKGNRVSVTYKTDSGEVTDVYLLSKDKKTLTSIKNENIIFERGEKIRFFSDLLLTKREDNFK